MNNAEANEPQGEQTKRTADSPVKTPGAETAHIKMSDAEKAAAGGEAHAGAGARTEKTKAGLHVGPQGLYEKPPRGVDVANDDGLDDTVDADAKSIQARRDTEMRAREPDSVINSNATPVNFVPEPGDGLGGFDSRPGRNGVLLALERGYRLVDRGMVAPTVPEVEDKVRFEGRDAHGHTLRGRKHYALNHLRPSRLFELKRG